MHILSLLLLCIYTPSIFSAASSRTNRRRTGTNTMSLQAYGEHIAQVERQQLINCIKKHEAKPCSTVAELTELKEHYVELFSREQNATQLQRLKKCITQCNTRMNIMLDIEATEINSSQTPEDVIRAAAIQEMHWHALRDTYQPDTKHFAYYNERARLASERYKISILNQDIARLLSQATVSQDEYNGLFEQANILFGEQAEQLLSQLPETKKIAMRSIQTTISTGITPQQSSKKVIRGINPNQAKQNKLMQLRRQVTNLCDAKHLTPKVRTAKLATLHKEIAQNSFGIEKQHASEAAQHFERMRRQTALSEKAHLLELSATTDEDCCKLQEVLIKLRDTYAIIDPNYEETNYKISMLDRKLWYLVGNIDKLKEANRHETDAARKCITDIFIDRLTKEDHLVELIFNSAPLGEQRALCYELLKTYNTQEPEHQVYQNKINQLDLMIEIDQMEQCDASELSDLTYFTENVRLRTLLLQTYEPGSPEYIAVQQGLEMHKALRFYTEAHIFAHEKMKQPITQDNVMYLHALIKDLYEYSQFVNKEHTTIIQTDWMEDKLTEYTQHITYYETISELEVTEQAPGDTRSKQQELLRELINSPITELSAKKGYLIRLINVTGDVITKLRVIRDELLPSGTLDTTEQIQWNKELAQLNLTRQIRSLREELKTAGIHEQISINKELAACIAKRKALENN